MTRSALLPTTTRPLALSLLPIAWGVMSTECVAQFTVVLPGTPVISPPTTLGSVLQFGLGGPGDAILEIPFAGDATRFFQGQWLINGANPVFDIQSGVNFVISPSQTGQAFGNPQYLSVIGGGTLTLAPGSYLTDWRAGLDIGLNSRMALGDRDWLTNSASITMGLNSELNYFDPRSGTFAGTFILQAGGGSATIDLTQNPDVTQAPGDLILTGTVQGDGDLRIFNAAGTASPNGVVLGFTQGSYNGSLVLDGVIALIDTSRSIGSQGIRVDGDSNVTIGNSMIMGIGQNLTLNGADLGLFGLNGLEQLTWNGDIDLGNRTLSIDSMQLTLTSSTDVTGPGTFDLTGSGILALNGVDASGTTVLSTGGILSGSGIVEQLGVGTALGTAFSGTIQMGNGASAGTLIVNGNANLGGAFLESVLYSGTGTADLLDVNGTIFNLDTAAVDLIYDASVAGGSLVPTNGTSVTYDILTGVGGLIPGSLALTIIDPLNNQFSIQLLDPNNPNTDAAGVQFSWDTSVSEVARLVITGAPNPSITTPGTTQTNIGTVNNTNLETSVNQLNSLVNSAGQSADGRFVGTSLLLLTPAVLPGAVVTATVPANPDALPNTTFNAMTQAGQVAKLRLMQLRDGGAGAASAQSASGSLGRDALADADYRTLSQGGVAEQGSVVNDPLAIDAAVNGASPSSGSRGWARGFGFYESVSGQSYAQGDYNASMGGLMAGADTVLDGNILAGAFAGITPGDLTISSTLGSTQNDLVGVNFGAYASWAPTSGEAYLQGYAMANYYDADQTRTIAIPGIDRTATSSANVWGAMVGAEGGLNMPLGSTTVLQPYAGLDYGYYTRDGYTESGADSLNLTVSSQDANLLQPTAGARLMQTFQVGRDRVTPYFGAAFIAQLPLGTWSETASSSFSGANVFSFTEGADEQYGASYQAGLEFAAAERWTAYISFNGMSMTDTNVFGGQIGINFEF